ncbi:MAG: metallophosphoesterase [bacterium]
MSRQVKTRCLFVSDLHGDTEQYEKLFGVIDERKPSAVFIGGDLLPSPLTALTSAGGFFEYFVDGYIAGQLDRLRSRLEDDYPAIFVILGNDDGNSEEPSMWGLEDRGLWRYAHGRCIGFEGYDVYGYSFVPPTPFRLKDWERYDVSRYVPPGCTSPETDRPGMGQPRSPARYATIQKDLELLAGPGPMDKAVFLFHAPPYETKLDRAALDGKTVDGVPLDLNVGSIAIRRFIERRQPLLTLHGHIHESTRLTGSWRDRIGRTHMFSAAHDGDGLALVEFDLEDLDGARLEIL